MSPHRFPDHTFRCAEPDPKGSWFLTSCLKSNQGLNIWFSLGSTAVPAPPALAGPFSQLCYQCVISCNATLQQLLSSEQRRGSHNTATSLRAVTCSGGRTGLRPPENLAMGIRGPAQLSWEESSAQESHKDIGHRGMRTTAFNLYCTEERRHRNSFLHVPITQTADKD